MSSSLILTDAQSTDPAAALVVENIDATTEAPLTRDLNKVNARKMGLHYSMNDLNLFVDGNDKPRRHSGWIEFTVKTKLQHHLNSLRQQNISARRPKKEVLKEAVSHTLLQSPPKAFPMEHHLISKEMNMSAPDLTQQIASDFLIKDVAMLQLSDDEADNEGEVHSTPIPSQSALIADASAAEKADSQDEVLVNEHEKQCIVADEEGDQSTEKTDEEDGVWVNFDNEIVSVSDVSSQHKYDLLCEDLCGSDGSFDSEDDEDYDDCDDEYSDEDDESYDEDDEEEEDYGPS